MRVFEYRILFTPKKDDRNKDQDKKAKILLSGEMLAKD